jgi:imidazole glycerol-phosphate synthase subunit HisF
MTGVPCRPEVIILNASRRTWLNPVTFALKLQELGVGEIILNSVDRDGRMEGYDFNLISSIYSTVTVPLTVLGGAGLMEDIKKMLNLFPFIGAAAGSLFVFKG